MLNDRNKFNFVTNCCWLAICLLSLTTTTFITTSRVQALSIQQTHKDSDELGGHGHSANALPQDSSVLNISPRLDYNNEWRPVGRGDPLKNDPTYDYSPPALERVRYWRADNESKDDASHANSKKQYSKDFATNNKKEILLLGMPSERHRGQPLHGEAPHLQPKYTAIRRSYYAHQHQLPTHLMPPPMQTLAPPTGHLMKPAITSEYRHNMPSSSLSSSSPSMSSSSSATTMAMLHSKPYFSTSASSPWMHTVASMKPSTSASVSSPSAMTPALIQHYHNSPHTSAYERDHQHHQEIMHQFSYTRPSFGVSFTPNNFIDAHPNSFKHNTVGARKPWLHELLQKEVVKVPPKMTLNKYEQMAPSIGISTTQTPVAFRPITTTTTTTTSTAQPMMSTTNFYTTTSPVYFTTTTMAPTMPASSGNLLSSTAPTTSKRLLIPTTSNLVHRPTVVPMKMTTDALFKHYNQPETPLLGPMYLIIEGHSKVKTYGKDELDPHKPKIVPIIPKREPIVRIADPNEKRGTKETFEVKHLHTVTTTPIPKTTSTSVTTAATTTAKTSKANKPKTTPTTTTTAKPATASTTKILPTTSTATTKSSKLNDETPPSNSPPTGMADLLSLLDSSFGSLFREEPLSAQTTASSKVDGLPNDKIFVTTPSSAIKLHAITKATVKTPLQQSQIEARIGTNSGVIQSLLDFENEETSSREGTTEPIPRDVRQVFDYDQLPESRLKDRIDVNIKDDDDNDESAESSDEVAAALNDSDEDVETEGIENLTSNEYEDENHQFIKRLDKLVDDIHDDDNENIEFEELASSEGADENDDGGDDDDADDLEMRHRNA